MSGSLKRAVAKWAGRVARGGGHSPIRSRPRGKASGARNLEGVAGLLRDSLPRRPGGASPGPVPLGEPRGQPGGSGGVRARSLRVKGSCFPAGLCRFRGVPGRSPPRAARWARGQGLGAAGAPVCFGLVCLFAVWPPLYVDQGRLWV